MNWADNAKDCAKDCLCDMLPLPNPCGKFGKLFGIAAGVAGGLMNSFPPDSLVHVMPDGSTEAGAHTGQSALKPIGDIKPGDRVLAFAEWKGKGTDAKVDARLSYERVEHVIASEHQQRLVHITLASGETLTATDGHPFKTPDGWRDAIMLKKGGQLLLKGDGEPPKTGGAQAGNIATIADVSTETRIVKVFNLEVANAHTYFVGKNAILVHNGCWKSDRKKYWRKNGPNGKPPQREVRVKDRRTGREYDRIETKELHHIDPQRNNGSNQANNLKEVWPTEHEAIDPYRHTGYDIIEAY